jgi:DNA mismatch repair protein MutS
LPENDTPMIRQYRAIKDNNQDKILFFRVGDFYEMFFEDAKTAAKELEITLTSRETGKGNHVPLAGFPYHAADTYISRLIEKGYKVAICEQVEDPKTAKGLVKRAVVRVITPGTLVEQAMLKEKENNYLLALAASQNRFGLAMVDISTGQLMATEFQGESAKEKSLDEFGRIGPAECLVAEDVQTDPAFKRIQGNALINSYPKSYFSRQKSEKAILEHFNCFSLDGVGLSDYPAVICAVGALLNYLKGNSGDIPHIKNVHLYHSEEYMLIDSISRRNLELTGTIRDGKRYGSLLWVLDKTLTSMGGRLLKRWMELPLLNLESILGRQSAVTELRDDIRLRSSMINDLKGVYDLERLISRINMGSGSPRDLWALKSTLLLLPSIKETLLHSNSSLKDLGEKITYPTEIVAAIEKALADNPPMALKEGGIIKAGFNAELDELRSITRDSRKWLADFESRERERTGIKSLKVRYNKVFGYYIEITRSNLDMAPADYIRKQTLVNAERYISEPLKEREDIILNAEDRMKDLEYQLFQDLRKEVSKQTAIIQENAALVAELDCLLSFALAAEEYGYIKPDLHANGDISIEGGRHPVVEQVLTEKLFVENDVFMGPGQRVILLTGPNMAGKSTYLRQTALLVLMAQMGCFIPARKASIGIVDRIFTRVGAADDLVGGQSTFMVEMNEVANILKNATEKSLIILDEVGRGTSTYDGVSIAWATTNYIYHHIKAKTLFATHYHELTVLEEALPGIKNFNIAVKERGEEVVFLRKVIPGPASRSYGIQVARLAGLPSELIKDAKEMLLTLETERFAGPPQPPRRQAHQMDLFSFKSEPSEAEAELQRLDLMTSTPLEVMQAVFEIQKKLTMKKREEKNG